MALPDGDWLKVKDALPDELPETQWTEAMRVYYLARRQMYVAERGNKRLVDERPEYEAR